MATLRLTTSRVTKANGEVSIIIVVGHKGRTANIKTGLVVDASKVKEKNGSIVIVGDKHLTDLADRKFVQARTALFEIQTDGEYAISRIDCNRLRDLIICKLNPCEKERIEEKERRNNGIKHYFEEYMETLNKGTREAYQNTLNRLTLFDKDIDTRTFEEVDVKYLKRFEQFLMSNSKSANGRGIKFRNIRAVFNYAIDLGATSYYPFRKRGFKIESEPTRSRALSIEQLKQLRDCEKEEYINKYVDLFFIIFGLIGINMPDLAEVKQIDKDGYIRYERHKTHKWYSIKVEDEVRELIERNKGKEHLLSFFDTNHDYDQVAKQMQRALRKLGIDDGISAYYARHSWASIALNDAGINMDSISAALGHSSEMTGMSVTQRYARTRQSTIDQANRKVIDLVF